MTKIEIAKAAVNIIVGAGTTKIVSQVVKNNTNPENVVDAVTIASSSVVVGMMAADATKTYTSNKIDEVVDWWSKNVTKN